MATLRAYVIVLLLGLAGQNTPAPPPLARASIEGVVVAAETGQPLKKANILLQIFDPNNFSTRWTDLPPAITDELGRFVMDGLDEGSYRGVVEREGFATQKYGQDSLLGEGKTLKLGGGQRARMDFKLVRAGVISGKVLDQNGRPARNITVEAYVEHKTAVRDALILIAASRTDDRGQYRIFGLASGSYVVGVGQLYHPSTLAPENAVAINLAGGEIPDIDFTLRPVNLVTVLGKVGIPFEQTPLIPITVPLDNSPTAAPGVQAIVPSSFVAVQLVREQELKIGWPQSTPSGVNRDGSFVISGVFLPGPYKLIATGSPEPKGFFTQRFAAMTRIVVSTTELRGINLELKPGGKVSGKISVDPAVRGSVQMKDLQVVLVSVDDVVLGDGLDWTVTGDGYDRVRPVTSMKVLVREDGSFVFDYVLPIEYRLAIEGLPNGVVPRSARFGSTNALLPFGVESGESRELLVTLGATR